MSGLILPGDTPRRGGLTILVPRGYEDVEGPKPIGVCTVQVGGGQVCNTPFFPGEERDYQRHVARCAQEHMAEIVAASPRTRMPIFDESEWDPEVAAHMKKVGKRMLQEGRMVVRKNERAGF